jgi:hypothetical protein
VTSPDLSTPTGIRESVGKFRNPGTTDTERGSIQLAWVAAGIPNQFAAMLRAAEMERAA